MRQDSYGINTVGCAMFLAWASMSSVMAQTHPAASVREALKNIKPSAGSCTGKKASKTKPAQYVHVAEVKPDLSCAIAPEDAAHLLKSPSTVLVDTRAATDFANFHIDGAMNLSSVELRSKTFLQGKSVILVGNGKAEREQYIDCKRLKSNGFKQVRVLRGGMPAWLVSGQDVLGHSPNPGQLTRLTPSDLWIESQFESNLVLVNADRETLQKQIKGSVLIPDERLQTMQAAIDKSPKKSKLSAVVLVSGQGADFQTLSQSIKPIPLLVYSETADAFARQLVQQAAVWTAQARGPKQPTSCGR
jgi:rhodanese-related sulfurtransferase